MRQQRFSIRKLKVGIASVAIGAFLATAGNATAHAQENVEGDEVSSQVLDVESPASDSAVVLELTDEVKSVSDDTTEVSVTTEVSTQAPSEYSETKLETELQVNDEGSVSSVKDNVLETGETVDKSDNTTTDNVEKTDELSEDVTVSTDEEDIDVKGVETETLAQSSDSSEEALSQDEVLAAHLDETVQPFGLDSNEIITVDQVWAQGYKGEGTVIAIIDSGIDVDHDVLNITDVTKAKYKTEEEIEAAKSAAGIDYGKWYSEKVIFAYNYVDANENVEEEKKNSHGMHVTGIAAGNPTVPVVGELIYGVAPEAQVMFMRVFSDISSTTGQGIYVQAIDDAVKLGADVINLSLGSANGSVVNADETLLAAIERARRLGVSVVIAAGNDAVFADGYNNPLATAPDYGLVATPSTSPNSISVASYNNTTVITKVLKIDGLEDDTINSVSYSDPEISSKVFEADYAYDYEFVGLGSASDFEGKDLTGKIALIKRGAITFTEKIVNATAAGAEGVVIFNSNPGEPNLNMSLDKEAGEIPSVFISNEAGELLAVNEGTYKIVFPEALGKLANPAANQMSDFSSWGLSVDGMLKPDVAAPGGSIYSSINEGEYGTMSGTSMASPHVAGVAALVKQYLKETYPEKTDQEISELVKALVMSTAKPHYNSEAEAYTSPRQQGAGIVDTNAAITTGLYVTGLDGYPSVTLGNVGDQLSFEVVLHNLNDEAVTLNYLTNLLTDNVEDGRFALTSRELLATDLSTVTVEAQSSQTLTITLDASQFTDELTELMPNGYYLEGFVRFVDAVDSGDVVSIPFVGFKGEFQNLPVVETNVYELTKNGESGTYFTPRPSNALMIFDNTTGIITSSSERIYSNDDRTDMTLKVLGTFKGDNNIFYLEVDEEGNPYLAISPNGDRNQDSLAFKGVFLRNYDNLVATVYAGDDTDWTTPLWSSDPTGGTKTFYSNASRPASTAVYSTEWGGYDDEGNPLPDGVYQYVVSFDPEVPGAATQTMAFTIIVDRQSPVITTATYDEETNVFTPRQVIEEGSGILRERVFYIDRTTLNGRILDLNDENNIVVLDNKVYVEQNEDGSYTLPVDKASLSDFYYEVEDYAGNVSYEKISTLAKIGNENGLVRVNVVDAETRANYGISHSYRVYDSEGKQVTDLPRYTSNNVLRLPFGEYTFELFLYDQSWATAVGENRVTIQLTEENSLQVVEFEVTPIYKGNLLVDIDQALPAGTTVWVSLPNGEKLQVPRATYSTNDYGRLLPVGEYELEIDLPEGYEFLEDLAVELETPGTTKTLTLINKTELLAELDKLENKQNDYSYYNATDEAKNAFDQAVEEAEKVSQVGSGHTQQQVDEVLKALREAVLQLTGAPTQSDALTELLAAQESVKNTALYYNADDTYRLAYDASLRAGQLVLDNTPLTQADVNKAVAEIQQALEQLNGLETDLTDLETAILNSQEVSQTYVYYNAPPQEQLAYQEALQLGRALVAQLNVTQADVDQAVAAIQQAYDALSGAKTVTTALEEAVKASDTVKTTAAYRNATATAVAAYDASLRTARLVLLKENATQSEVDAALVQVLNAQNQLDGQPADKAALQQLVEEQAEFQRTAAQYYNASQELQADYLAALQRAKAVLADENVTNEEVAQALAALKQAQDALDGVATVNDALENAVEEAVQAKTTVRYLLASLTRKNELDVALTSAQAVLENQNATQAVVDVALAQLLAALEALDGVAVSNNTTVPPKSDETDSNNDASDDKPDSNNEGSVTTPPSSQNTTTTSDTSSVSSTTQEVTEKDTQEDDVQSQTSSVAAQSSTNAKAASVATKATTEQALPETGESVSSLMSLAIVVSVGSGMLLVIKRKEYQETE